MELYILLAISVISLVIGVIGLVQLAVLKRQTQQTAGQEELIKAALEGPLKALRGEMLTELRESRKESSETIQHTVKNLGSLLTDTQKQTNELLGVSQERLRKAMADFALQSEQKLENIRTAVEKQMMDLRQDNTIQLEKMRATVDEKLQKTLEDRISQSFRLVTERLEQVNKGLGEMQAMAANVGDLKKVLSNVKTRGILGEIQLGAILEEILTPEQYATNVATKKGSTNVVEYAVKMPGKDGSFVYLPIDAKFPGDTYAQLMDAYDSGDPAAVEAAGKALEQRIRGEAKDIRDKYIAPPDTTDFGILFLPVEGLYAEVVRRGLIETLQRDYHVNIAGPTTMAALLNSLRMGFNTLAIEKRSSEVWKILGAVKTEFDTFGKVVESARKRLEQADAELDRLVGVRTRVIQRKLRAVEKLPQEQTAALLSEEEETLDPDEDEG